MPNALADQFRNIYNAMIPTAYRTFGEFMLGSNVPITEQNISPDVLAFMRKQVEDKRVEKMAEMAKWRGLLDETPEEYAKNPIPDNINSVLGLGGPLSFEKAREKARYELEHYDPKHIIIDKYVEGFRNPDTSNVIFKHPYDTAANLTYTLGRYHVRETPEGDVAYDKYDFDNTPGNNLMSPGGIAKLNALANLVHPGKSIPVRIKLNGRK